MSYLALYIQQWPHSALRAKRHAGYEAGQMIFRDAVSKSQI
jgi:hypothetical protein